MFIEQPSKNVSTFSYMSTRPDMWHGKPAREERTTSYQTLDAERPRPGVPMWIKSAIVVVIMFCFLLALKSILRW